MDKVKAVWKSIAGWAMSLSYKTTGILSALVAVISALLLTILDIQVFSILVAIGVFGLIYSIVVPIQEKRVANFEEMEDNL